MDNNRGSGSAIGGQGDYTGKSPDELVTHGKQIFSALGKLDRDQRQQVLRQWREDPATANVFSELMESTA